MPRVFGKLENGELTIRKPNTPVYIAGDRLFTNDPNIMLEAGYKLVVSAEHGGENENYAWVENETEITQVRSEEQ